MKIRIQAAPGELETRADDLVKVVRELAGHSCAAHLEKAAPVNRDQIPRKLDLPALQGGVDRASKAVQRIRRHMLQRMLEVVNGGSDS